VKTLVETSQNIILQLQDWKDEMEQASEATILEMVKEIARTLFGHGFALEQEALQQAFHHVLENARSLGDLRIYVNPEDARNLDAYWREFQTNFTGHQVQILSTDAITRGGCFVQGEMGSVDARIETQMAAIMDTLNASMHSENQEQDAGPGA